jgi:hypothetical protein
MKDKDSGAWLTLNTSYYAAPAGNPLTLLEDSELILQHARGVVQVVRDALHAHAIPDSRSLAHTLAAVEVLMQMGSGSAEVAYRRFQELGDTWLRHGHLYAEPENDDVAG